MRWPFSRSSKLPSGAALYARIVAEARRPDWYLAAAIPDSLDGRFAVLSTLLALTDLRLGQGGEVALERAPRLAECFIADMDVQMREAGFGDPGLGKQVRMMVGALASRVETWRGAVEKAAEWEDAVVPSLYRDNPPDEKAVSAAARLTRDWWRRLEEAGDDALVEGRIG